MDFAWFALYALGGALALYGIVIVGLFVLAVLTYRGEAGSVRFVSGETTVLPPEPVPERPRKGWRIKIERV